MYSLDEVRRVDPEIADAIVAEQERQNSHIELIASENWVSKAVMAAMGSPLTNKYAEGYPGKRYYGGCECVDVVEELAKERAMKLFNCTYCLLYTSFEFAESPLAERIWASLFQSVTPRTAGFNTVDLTQISETGLLLMIILMLVGGSPGSTAGGMKTTTFAVILSTVASVFRSEEHTHLFKRRIEERTVRNAATILTMYLTMFLAGGFVISRIEELPLLTCLYETASAVGTVGLSLGITSELGMVSRSILILLMYLGRVGGLTLVFAALSGHQGNTSRLPREKITVG